MSFPRLLVVLKEVIKKSEPHLKDVQKHVKTAIKKVKWWVTPKKIQKRRTVEETVKDAADLFTHIPPLDVVLKDKPELPSKVSGSWEVRNRYVLIGIFGALFGYALYVTIKYSRLLPFIHCSEILHKRIASYKFYFVTPIFLSEYCNTARYFDQDKKKGFH